MDSFYRFMFILKYPLIFASSVFKLGLTFSSNLIKSNRAVFVLLLFDTLHGETTMLEQPTASTTWRSRVQFYGLPVVKSLKLCVFPSKTRYLYRAEFE